jgi:hypothetical protein
MLKSIRVPAQDRVVDLFERRLIQYTRAALDDA